MAPKPSNSGAPAKGSKYVKGFARKANPKQPIPVPERLKRYFKSLCAQIDGGHFRNAIKTCDKILRLQADDPDALQTKLYLLLQTEQYQAALDFINLNDKQSQYAFERAYSLYRLQQETEARDILNGIKAQVGDDHRGVMHLEAQLNYRQGSYQDALDIYSQLLDTAETHSEEHSDILTNLQAAQKHLDFINTDYLRALDSLPASTVAALVSAPPPVQSTSSSTAAVTSASTSSPVADALAPKKTRKSRVPPGVVPGVTPPPDPERWLKKSERSTFGQGKRRRAGGGGATQGSVNAEVAPASSGKSTGAKNKKKR